MASDNLASIGGGGTTAILLSVNNICLSSSIDVLYYGVIGGIGGYMAKELAKFIIKKSKEYIERKKT